MARLARLDIDPADEGRVLDDLNTILQWVEQLDRAEIGPQDESVSLRDAETTLRPDVPLSPLDRLTILDNAPYHREYHIAVPLQVKKRRAYEDR